jgi:hypothetical protein
MGATERNDRIREAVRESVDLMGQWSLRWPLPHDERRRLFIDTIAGNVAAALDRADLPPDFPSLDA